MTSVAELVAAMDARYPAATAESWDRVGLVVGELAAPADRLLLAVDCVPETVDEAVKAGVDAMVVHHPLLLRGVHSVATDTYKGAVVHRLIRAGIALLVAHTNADAAVPGVSDALAERLGLLDVATPDPDGMPPVRTGRLAEPMALAELTAYVAARLPATVSGVRAAGDPRRTISTLALAGGAGDDFLADVARTGADAYLCADLRHHPASEHLAAGRPALIEAAHWATERIWLDALARELRSDLGADIIVSDVVTDVWTVHAHAEKEPHS